MMIAQHQIEAPSRPSMTSFTTICADRNMLQRETSTAGEETPEAAISAGFITEVLAKLRSKCPRYSPDALRRASKPPSFRNTRRALTASQGEVQTLAKSLRRTELLDRTGGLTLSSTVIPSFLGLSRFFVSLKCDALC